MTAPAASSAVACGGDGCRVQDPWPLHHFRHRGVFFRLCTSCVLLHNRGAFCTSCFEVFDSGDTPPPRPTVSCAKCPSSSHIACLSDPSSPESNFTCPACSDPDGFSFFPIGGGGGKGRPDGGRGDIDLPSARVLLAAAQLAAASMRAAAAAAKADADKRVKDAAASRKIAREMLEFSLIEAEKKKKMSIKAKDEIAPIAPPAAPPPEVVVSKETQQQPKKPHRSVPNRDEDKWRRFQKPIRADSSADGIDKFSSVDDIAKKPAIACINDKAMGPAEPDEKDGL